MYIAGFIKKILFHNEKDGYGCFILDSDKKNIICKGVFNSFNENLPITLKGTYHKTSQGMYFSFDSYTLTDDNYRILKSLEIFSDEDAKRLSKEFPDLYNAIETANTVKDFKKNIDYAGKESKIIFTKLKKIMKDKSLFNFILDNGGRYIDYIKASKIYNDAENKLKSNPYEYGIRAGFKYSTCNNIAKKEGITDIAKIKVRGILQYMIKDAVDAGDTYVEISDISNRIERYSRVKNEILQIPDKYILNLAKLSEDFVVTDKEIIKRHIWNEESKIAKSIKVIENMSKKKEIKNEVFEEICQKQNIVLSKSQKEALACVEKNGFSIITGGPGSGKTTLINLILSYFKKEIPEEEICLCAPTGCAAQNLSDKTGMIAETVHKVLGITPYSETKNIVTKKINAKVCVIDECSMLDTNLAYLLFTSLPKDAYIYLVGDVNQLPSIGYGQVFADIINSKLIPVYELKEVHRQGADSTIVKNANKIIKGETDLETDPTFNIMTVLSPEDAYELATSYIQNIEDINKYQVLSPIKKTYAGTYKLNAGIQEVTNPYKDALFRYGAYNFKMHDKVIMINNNYNKGYYNGDTGEIIDADDYGIEIKLNKKCIYIEKENFEDIALAYAITIHKSQGSEYKNVIIILTDESSLMSNRNLIYTAVTRAKESVTIIETKGALNACIKKEMQKRNTLLLKMLKN